MISTDVLHTAIPHCRGLFIDHPSINCQKIAVGTSPWVFHMRRRVEEMHNTELRSLSAVISSITDTSRGCCQRVCAAIVDAVIPHRRAYIKCDVSGGTVAVILEAVTPIAVTHDVVTWSQADDGVTTSSLRKGDTDFAAVFEETYGLGPVAGETLPVQAFVTAKVLGETEGSFLVPVEYLWMDKEEDNITKHSSEFSASYPPNQLRGMVPVVEIDPPAYTIVKSECDY